jgi:hypothetical protein
MDISVLAKGMRKDWLHSSAKRNKRTSDQTPQRSALGISSVSVDGWRRVSTFIFDFICCAVEAVAGLRCCCAA